MVSLHPIHGEGFTFKVIPLDAVPNLKSLLLHTRHDVIKKKTIKFNFFNFVVVRYARIAIASAPVILFYFILPQLSHGPFYSTITNHMADACKRTGHKIFFLTTNIGDCFLDMCIVGNWYLSSDSHAYLVSFFVIYYLAVKPKIGFALIAVQSIFFSTIAVLYGNYYRIPAYLNVLDIQV